MFLAYYIIFATFYYSPGLLYRYRYREVRDEDSDDDLDAPD